MYFTGDNSNVNTAPRLGASSMGESGNPQAVTGPAPAPTPPRTASPRPRGSCLAGGAAPGSPPGSFFPAESPEKPKCHPRLSQIGSQTGPLGSGSPAAWAGPLTGDGTSRQPARLPSFLFIRHIERPRGPLPGIPEQRLHP